MSATQTTTRTIVRGAPGRPGAPGAPGGAPAVSDQQDPEDNGPDYSERPNAPPKTEEAVPSAEWARWRLYKQRPDIKDKFPEYFPDVRRQLHQRLNAEVQAAMEDVPETRFEKRYLDELKDGYKPKQLGFAPLTQFYIEADQQNARLSRRQRIDSDDEGDRIPSLWFERMAHDLFARVWEFCSDTFGLNASIADSYNNHDWTLRWLDKLPKEFVVLASQVARGDMTVVPPKGSDPNNWEFLFLDDKSRVKLMVGVMAKLLEENLFNSLLCGAADVEKTALTADDHARAFLDNSYQRNRTRSETVRNYIQANRAPLGTGLRDLFTDNFWVEVDSVTMGILDLLLPMINLLGQDMPNYPWPPLKKVHQQLHDIVAEAAWFTNGMRASKSIFWIQFPLPGELNDISHEHAIDDIWNRSKASSIAHDKEAKARWATKRDAEITKDHPGEAITEARRAAYAAAKPPPHVRRTAKVQVAMWPFIKRFTPMGERDVGDGAYNTGETITQIMKAQCVYYNGDDADAADLEERRTLSEQIRSRRWAKWFTLRAFLIYALIFGVFLLVTSPGFQQQVDSHSGVGKTSSGGQETLKERKTTTIVAVPVGTEIVTETVVVTDSTGDEGKPSKPWFGSKAPSVSKARETVTETLVTRFDRGADDNNNDDDNDDYDSDDDSESSDDNSENSRSGSVLTEEGIAAKLASAKERVADSIVSAKDKVTDGIVSAKDKATDRVKSKKDKAAESIASVTDSIASEFASTTDRLQASLSSEKDKIASIESSVKESVSNSIADKQSRSSAASRSSAEESSSSLAASIKSAEESKKSKSASRSSAMESREASRRSAAESSASSRSSSKESKSASQRSVDESKSSSRSSRSSVASEKSAEAERSAASESRSISDRVASSMAAEEKAKRIATSIASVEEEKASGSSSASKERAHSRKTKSKDGVADTTTVVTNVGDPVSVEDVMSGKVAASAEKDKETITITVPADKVVVTVTGPAAQAETKGAIRTAVDKANKFAAHWRGIASWFHNSFSIWALLRYLLVSFVGPYGFISVVVLVLLIIALKPWFDGWRRRRNLRNRRGAAQK